MQHIIFIYYIVSLASGVAGILLSFLHYLKVRRRIVGQYIGMVLLFTVYLLLLNIHYYQRTVVLFDSDVVHALAVIMLAIALGCLYYLVPAALHTYFEKRMPRTVAAGFLCLALLPLLETVTGFFIRVAWGGPPLPRIVNYLVVGYALVFLIKERRRLAPPKRGMARLILASIIGFLLMQAVDDVQGLLNPGHYPVTALPLYYFLCNAASVVIVFRNFQKTPLPAAAGPGDAFVETYRITDREREVIMLIIEGCANKQIAARLGVSFSTVKNHIYNIFQKTGARSKIELFRRLAGEKTEPSGG
jgi:DNA-binding CsgD family transcriptional regulator